MCVRARVFRASPCVCVCKTVNRCIRVWVGVGARVCVCVCVRVWVNSRVVSRSSPVHAVLPPAAGFRRFSRFVGRVGSEGGSWRGKRGTTAKRRAPKSGPRLCFIGFCAARGRAIIVHTLLLLYIYMRLYDRFPIVRFVMLCKSVHYTYLRAENVKTPFEFLFPRTYVYIYKCIFAPPSLDTRAQTRIY